MHGKRSFFFVRNLAAKNVFWYTRILEKQSIKISPGPSIEFRLHISEFGPENPTHLKGIFYNKNGQPDTSGVAPIYINAAIKNS